jgi:hypothetical protein
MAEQAQKLALCNIQINGFQSNMPTGKNLTDMIEPEQCFSHRGFLPVWLY